MADSRRVVKALLDTNILIDFLKGISEARDEIELYAEKAISIISWMEVMAGAPPGQETATRAFLNRFEIIPLDADIAEAAVGYRRDMRIKLPDAVIFASAARHSMLIVTRNTKYFPEQHPAVRVPYRLG